MKESKFIELLNLYVDHEISPAEVAELEAEIHANPERRRIYAQYCRIQKGCTVLAEHFQTDAPAAPVLTAPVRRAWPASVYAGGLVAAAACVAVILTVRPRQAAPLAADFSSAPAVATTTPPTPAAISSPVQATPPATTVVRRMNFEPVLVSHTLRLNEFSNEAEAGLAAAEQPRLDWLQNVKLSPMRIAPVDDLRFDSPATLQQDNRVFGTRRPLGTAEMTAFQFQK